VVRFQLQQDPHGECAQEDGRCAFGWGIERQQRSKRVLPAGVIPAPGAGTVSAQVFFVLFSAHKEKTRHDKGLQRSS